MVDETSDGLPYPTGTDLVRDGDNAIAALAAAVSQLTRWVKVGRVDRVIEGNGYLRLTVAEAWPSGKVPTSIVAIGITAGFRPTWNGTADGAGCLLTIFDVNNNPIAAGQSVAIYFAAFRPAGAG